MEDRFHLQSMLLRHGPVQRGRDKAAARKLMRKLLKPAGKERAAALSGSDTAVRAMSPSPTQVSASNSIDA